MSDSEFLDTAELRDLTQRAHKDAQMRELDTLGIPYLLQRGRLLVSRFHARERLAGRSIAVVRRPNLQAVR